MIRPRAVVIEPTRELSIQVLREARKLATGAGRGDDDQSTKNEWKIAVLGEEGVGVPVAAKKGRGKKKNKKGKETDKKKEEAAGAAIEKAGKGNAGDAESEAEEEEVEGPTTTVEATAEEGDAAQQQPYYGPVGEYSPLTRKLSSPFPLFEAPPKTDSRRARRLGKKNKKTQTFSSRRRSDSSLPSSRTSSRSRRPNT